MSQSPWGIRPQWVNLPRVSDPDKSIFLGYQTPMSQSPCDIRPRWVNLPRVLDPNQSISLGYQTPVSQSPWGIRPQRVNLPGLSDPGESISLGYQTSTSQFSWGIRPRWVNLPGVLDPGSQYPMQFTDFCNLQSLQVQVCGELLVKKIRLHVTPQGLIPQEVNSHFLKTFYKAFKGTVSQNECGFLFN